MRLRFEEAARRTRFMAGAVALCTLSACASSPATTTDSRASSYARTADGKPDLNGIWQAMNSANWNIEAHEAKQGPVVALGAAFAVPPGIGVVEGGDIPYQPAALAKRNENAANWVTRDPEVKCYMPGIPRATYQGFTFQIVKYTDTVLMAYEFASASRIVRMNSTEKSPAPAWMGWSIGKWEGDTLVVDVTDQVEDTWFDRAGNFHSDELHVVERFTPVDANTIDYEATIEDAKFFTRPCKMRMFLYRRLEPNAQLMEYKCVPFVEELMYGHLRQKPTAGK